MRVRIAMAALPMMLGGCIPNVAPPDRGYPAAPPPTMPSERPQAPPRETPPDEGPGEGPGQGYERPAIDAPVATLPAQRPVWETRPVAPDAPEIAAQTYVVRAGDTLRSIGNATGAGSEAIARANGLASPFTVRVGQTLRIPGGRYHAVQLGQTGIAIARAYGVEWSRIVAANGLEEPFVLRLGQRVLIPGADRPRTAAERAAAFNLDVDDILTGGEPTPATDQRPARPVRSAARVLPPTAVVAEPPRLAGRFAWPVTGAIVKRFGAGGTGDRSNGIKIAVPIETPIRAASDGVVAYVGDGIAALGGLVIVKHGAGWTSVYGHASRLLVRRGQAVTKGQTIALSGDTGFADRPELHFELRRGRTPVDPVAQLPRL